MKTESSILIVDDNEMLCDNLRDALEDDGFTVGSAHNGKDAISLSESNKYDIALVDFNLPDISGTELVNNLVGTSPSMEFLLITAHATLESAIDQVKQGRVISYKLKPLDLDHILLLLKEVSKRRNLEKLLKESEEKYCSLSENTQDAILSSVNGIITDWNKSAEKLFGYTRDRIIGQPINILFPDKHKKEHLGGFDRFAKTGEVRKISKSVEVSALTKEGIEIQIEMYLNCQRLGREEYLCTAIIRDIGERREAVEHLRKLAHAMEFSPSTIVITDTAGRIEYANPKFTQLTGYSIEEAIGKNPSILKSGKTSSKVYEELWKTIKNGNEWRGEFCNRKKNGDLYWESASISPVKNDKGVITNFVAIKNDITVRRQTVKKLKESEAKLHNIMASLYEVSIIIYDRDGKILELWSSPEMNKRYGMHAVDTVGRSIRDFVPPDQIEQRLAEIHRVFDSGEKILLEYVAVFPGGCFWQEASLCRMQDSIGNITGVIGFIRDVTKRKKMEGAILQSEKLNSLGTITAGIAHEFNNILGIVLGSAEVLEGGHNDERALKRGLVDIIKACDDGGVIVKRMRAFSDVEVKQSDCILYDVGHIIKDAIDFTMPRWKHVAQISGTKFHIDTDGMKNTPEIFCNPTELREVFVNLINNAINAMPDGGSIFFSMMSYQNKVLISVSDTGIGMTEYVKKNVFDPFYSTRKPQGTGLGMSIAYSIIKRHGGNIEVESEVGKGATFTLSIPISKAVVQRAELSEQISEIACKKFRVLVIDDERRMCETLKKFFSKDGHMVKTASNGAYAIELAGREEFDLVLCDLAMTDTNGYDVIKVLNRTEYRPVIGIITGWNEELPLLEKEEFKVDFVVRKPFSFSELAKKINEQIQNLRD